MVALLKKPQSKTQQSKAVNNSAEKLRDPGNCTLHWLPPAGRRLLLRSVFVFLPFSITETFLPLWSVNHRRIPPAFKSSDKTVDSCPLDMFPWGPGSELGNRSWFLCLEKSSLSRGRTPDYPSGSHLFQDCMKAVVEETAPT